MSGADYSIVIPVYFNEESLEETFDALYHKVALANPLRKTQFVFVDDGSADCSLQLLLKFRENHPELVHVIRLTRNFGQVPAIMAGLRAATGNSVVVISADGQDPPEVIAEMLTFREAGHEVIIACREGRDEGFYRRTTSRFFYWLMKRLTFPNMPPGGFDFVCLGRKAVDMLLRNGESHPFFQGQVLWLGLRPQFIGYTRRARARGISRWTFSKKITYLLDGVLSYSYLPLRVMSLTGFFFSCLGFLYALLILMLKLLNDIPVEGWAPLMIVVLVLGGIQMLMMGFIGEYLWRVLAQSRNRELYLVEESWPESAGYKN